MLRIPEWCTGQTVTVNGQPISSAQRVRGYVRISRKWSPNDIVGLEMPLPVRQVYANPLVQADTGRSGVMRGPIVYCVESADNSRVPQLVLPRSATLSSTFENDLLDGVVVVSAQGTVSGSPSQALYSTSPQAYQAHSIAIKAIPYYANANRGPVNMAVWLPYTT
jgi:DUF1680 family protein